MVAALLILSGKGLQWDERDLELDDIQGIVLSGYGKLEWSSFSLLRIESPVEVKQYLKDNLCHITTATKKSDVRRFNVAFTASGLSKLGVSDVALSTFSRQFKEGMAHKERSRVLGDVSGSEPIYWAWGSKQRPVDLVMMLYAKSEPALKELQTSFLDAPIAAGVFSIVSTVPSKPTPKTSAGFSREHFGFADGVSQPVIAGSVDPKSEFADELEELHGDYLPHTTIAAGEFLHGYRNEYEKLPEAPILKLSDDALNSSCRTDQETKAVAERNGTYLVMRQLDQNVPEFWKYMDEQTRNETGPDDVARVRLASKMVGRWPNGAALTDTNEERVVSTDERKAANDVFFAETDAHGFGCPLGSHIRRANPRDTLDFDPLDPIARESHDSDLSHEFSKRHRIIRRGRNYGTYLKDPLSATPQEEKQDRGLLFICLNADIGRQFEFIQHTWLNSAKFNNLYDETDPLLGPSFGDSTTNRKSFSIQRPTVRCRVHGMERFVTVKGGAYFFLPGIESLRSLVEPNKSSTNDHD